MRRFLASWAAMSVMGAAQAADKGADLVCPEEPVAAMVQAASDVEQGFVALEREAFDLARSRLGLLVRCVDAQLTVGEAVGLHRARALIAFVDEDLEASKRAFAAIHRLDPSWNPGRVQLPMEHPVWRAFEASVDDDEDPVMLPLTAAPEHGLAVDGTKLPLPSPDVSLELPADRAFVLQVFGDGGAVSYTGYHFSTVDIPVQDLVVMPDPRAMTRARRRKARIAGGVVGGALLAGAGATFALGWEERSSLTRGEVEPRDVDGVQRRANVYGTTAYSLAGAGALALTMGLAIPW